MSVAVSFCEEVVPCTMEAVDFFLKCCVCLLQLLDT
jgi:hypothetical protein